MEIDFFKLYCNLSYVPIKILYIKLAIKLYFTLLLDNVCIKTKVNDIVGCRRIRLPTIDLF